MQGKPSGKSPRRARLVNFRASQPASVTAFATTNFAPLADEQIDLPTDVPVALPNGKLPLSALEGGFEVQAPLWKPGPGQQGARVGDYIGLRFNGKTYDPNQELTAPLPDPCVVPVPADFFKDEPDGVETPMLVQFLLLSSPGEQPYIYNAFSAIVDKTMPGGTRVPPIEFPEDIVKNGLTLAQLLLLPDQKLKGVIANYDHQGIGDTIHLFMKLRPGGPEIPAGTVSVVSRDGGIAVEYDRATLELVNGFGTVEFYHYITNEVGRQSVTSASSPVDMLIVDAPDTIPPPIVPALETDDLVIDPEARPTLEIQIPAYTPKAIVGDSFVVHVGKSSVTTEPLKAEDVDNDPLLSVAFPYNDLLLASTPYADVFNVDVSYDIIRGKFSSPSQPLDTHFDLTLPGGPDPDPDPDPNPDPGLPDNPNANLVPPTLRGADGSDNSIPPDESTQDAEGIVPYLNADGDVAFMADDVVQLYMRADADAPSPADKIGTPYTILPADLTADLSLPVTSAEMLTHPGGGAFYYGIARALADGQTVEAFSPRQLINIQSKDAIPGAGSPLEAGTFADWVGKRSYAINISDARGGTPVRIRLDQANVGVGNTIKWTFRGFDENKVEVGAAKTEGIYEVVADDMVPRPDNTLPKPPPDRNPPAVDRPFVDITIAEVFILPIVFGTATFDYTITNGVGTGAANQDTVAADVRQG